MNNTPKNHHYVPAFYLENFQDSNLGLCLFDRYTKKKIFINQSAKKWAKQKDFYKTDPQILKNIFCVQTFKFPFLKYEIDFDDPEGIEKFFSKIEKEAKLIFKNIINGSIILNKENKVKILYFLYFLAYRTNAYRNGMKFLHDQLINQLKERNYGEKYYKAFTEKIGMQYGEEYYQISRLFNTQNISEYVSDYLDNYYWLLGNVDGNMGLLTTDDPAILFLFHLSYWCFPIAPKVGLIFIRKRNQKKLLNNNENELILLSSTNVIEINSFNLRPTLRYKYVFGTLSDLNNIIPFILDFDKKHKSSF